MDFRLLALTEAMINQLSGMIDTCLDWRNTEYMAELNEQDHHEWHTDLWIRALSSKGVLAAAIDLMAQLKDLEGR